MSSIVERIAERVDTLLSTPKRRGIAMLIGLAMVILIVVVAQILSANDKPKGGSAYESRTETDPVSGQEILFDSNQSEGDAAAGAMYVGCGRLLTSGMRDVQFQLLQEVLDFYAGSRNMELERVSCYPDTIAATAPSVFEADVMLNVDEERLHVKLDASRSPRTSGNVDVTFYDTDGRVVYSY